MSCFAEEAGRVGKLLCGGRSIPAAGFCHLGDGARCPGHCIWALSPEGRSGCSGRADVAGGPGGRHLPSASVFSWCLRACRSGALGGSRPWTRTGINRPGKPQVPHAEPLSWTLAVQLVLWRETPTLPPRTHIPRNNQVNIDPGRCPGRSPGESDFDHSTCVLSAARPSGARPSARWAQTTP